jgi:hypothetical protein
MRYGGYRQLLAPMTAREKANPCWHRRSSHERPADADKSKRNPFPAPSLRSGEPHAASRCRQTLRAASRDAQAPRAPVGEATSLSASDEGPGAQGEFVVPGPTAGPSFGEVDALFLRRGGISSAAGGCSDRDQFPDSGRGARLTDNRLARPANKAQFRGPFLAAARCHSRSSRTRRERLPLEQTSMETRQKRTSLWPRR